MRASHKEKNQAFSSGTVVLDTFENKKHLVSLPKHFFILSKVMEIVRWLTYQTMCITEILSWRSFVKDGNVVINLRQVVRVCSV